MAYCDKHSLYIGMKSNSSSTSCGYYVDININFDNSDYLFKVPADYANKPGKLALYLYDDERFSWVFTYFNRTSVNNPIFDLTEGKIIRIPTKERLLSYF